jgi:hypothetical protein
MSGQIVDAFLAPIGPELARPTHHASHLGLVSYVEWIIG